MPVTLSGAPDAPRTHRKPHRRTTAGLPGNRYQAAELPLEELLDDEADDAEPAAFEAPAFASEPEEPDELEEPDDPDEPEDESDDDDEPAGLEDAAVLLDEEPRLSFR